MTLLRAFLLQHRALALLVAAVALLMKVAVPTGMMIAPGSQVVTLRLCDDAFGEHATARLVIPVKGEHHGGPVDSAAKGHCPFAVLSMASAPGADLVLLALALAFIVALAFVPPQASPRPEARHLRPPLRGPPAAI